MNRIIALLGIVCCFPLILILSICIIGLTKKRILFIQKRVGYLNKEFSIYKLSSIVNSDHLANRKLWIVFSAWMRKLKLDELTQLFNIINGDMNFIGPRPLMKEDFMKYPETVQLSIYNIKPGITGLGSLVFQDEQTLVDKAIEGGWTDQMYREQVIAPYKGALELWYQENRDIFINIKIVLLTFWSFVYPSTKLVFIWLPKLPHGHSTIYEGFNDNGQSVKELMFERSLVPNEQKFPTHY